MNENQELAKLSVKFVKDNVKLLVDKFASLERYPPNEKPFSLFMAGSPGAGKTEFSRGFCKAVQEKDPDLKIVRIDADEIKELIPYYNGSNSDAVQGASSLGVQKLFDYVQNHNQNLMLDGTFADRKLAFENIKRSLNRGRRVGIIYLYQDPLVAWDITQKREKLEGRFVPKEMFIDSLFAAKDNVNEIKSIFDKNVVLTLIVRDDKVRKPYFNIDKIDNYLKIKYTREELLKKL